MAYELPPTFNFVSIWIRTRDIHKCVFYIRTIDIAQVMRYKWYFEYMRALLVVNYPKAHVELKIDRTQEKSDLDVIAYQKKRIRDKIIKCKADITKYSKALNKFETDWNEMFPFSEDEKYKRTYSKLKQIECKKQNLEMELYNFDESKFDNQKDRFIEREKLDKLELKKYGSNGIINFLTFRINNA